MHQIGCGGRQLATQLTFHHVLFDDLAELLHMKLGEVLAFLRSF